MQLHVAEIVGLAIVIAIVWGLLLLPVIFYHLPDVSLTINTSYMLYVVLLQQEHYIYYAAYSINFHRALHAWNIIY